MIDICERISRSLDTVHKMFRRRNYIDITEPSKVQLGLLNVICVKANYKNPRDGKTEQIHCLWIPFNHIKLNSAVGKNEISQYCSHLSDLDHVILIADAVSFQAVDYMKQSSFYWEILSYHDTSCDKMEHRLVPLYKILSETEIKNIEKKYGSRDKFPKMVVGLDAIARFMDFRLGDVVEIRKRSSIVGVALNYRQLVDSDSLI